VKCVWCSDTLGVVSGWLIYPKPGEKVLDHPLNVIECCLACRGLRGSSHAGPWLADCLHRPERTPDKELIVSRLEQMVAVDLPRAKSELYNVQEAIRFNDPTMFRMAKLAPLLERSHGRCVWCRRELGLKHAETSFEHLVPRSRGGGDQPDNLLAACRACNSRRGNMSPPDWVEKLISEGKQPQIALVGQQLQKLETGRRKRQAKWARLWNNELKLIARRVQGTVPIN